MNLLIQAVEKIAPVLASSMLGPAGGIVTSLIESTLGLKGDELASALPINSDLQVKLRQIETEHADILAQYANDDYKTEVDDRKDARSENDKHFWIIATLAIVFILSYFGFVFFKSHLGLTADDSHQTQDVLTNALFLVLSYFYGSSHNK